MYKRQEEIDRFNILRATHLAMARAVEGLALRADFCLVDGLDVYKRQAMGLSRSDIYLTHLVKYRPALPRQLTNNRPPTDREIEISRPILREEIMLVRPKVVVALGAIAARGILQSGETPLSALRGIFHTAVSYTHLISSLGSSSSTVSSFLCLAIARKVIQPCLQ